MAELFPPIEPFAVHRLAVDNRHVLYIEESGNPQGIPVLFLHGGPGSGCRAMDHRFFNPALYRTILFDQRGVGYSRPQGELQDNTTAHLVADMEAIRQLLAIDRWLLFGGSWGAALALLYAQQHTEHTLGLVLRAVFLGRHKDMDWLYGSEGVARLFPERWQAFLDHLPPQHRHDPVAGYYRLLNHIDEAPRQDAARAWANWSGHIHTWNLGESYAESAVGWGSQVNPARIECHYMEHRCFMASATILDNAARLRGLPGMIVHGRQDLVCPVENAWSLQRAWPDAELRIIPEAGHLRSERPMIQALVSATSAMARRIRE